MERNDLVKSSCCQCGGNCREKDCCRCPEPQKDCLKMPSCQELTCEDLGEIRLRDQGRILRLKVKIREVCPGRRLGVAVLLWELDPWGRVHPRGMKTMEVYTGTGEGCRDLSLDCVEFVVPESVRCWGSPGSLCEDRRFRARVLANYLDMDYICCEQETSAEISDHGLGKTMTGSK